MAERKPLVNVDGTQTQLPDADLLKVGAGVKFADGSDLSSKLIAGRTLLNLKHLGDASGVANGLMQNALWRNRSYFCQAMGNSSISLDTTGYVAPANVGVTLTGRTLAATNYFTRQRRVGYVSAATAGSIVSTRSGSVGLASLGDGAGLGGFFNVIRFGCSDAATVSGARMFVGATTSGANPTNVEPSTLTGCIGVGHGASDTNLKLFYGGSSAQTPIDLGASFPANTLSTDVYELILYSPSGENGVVYYQLTRLNTGDVASGSVVRTSTAVLPASSAFLLPWLIWRSNNATALSVAFDFMFDYFDTDGF